MNRMIFRCVFGLLLAGCPAFGGGCTMLPGDAATEGLKLKDPDAKFMKQVERDPFPRADAASTPRR